MIDVSIVQFMRPDGRRVAANISLPDEVAPKVKAIQECGCELTAEVLMNGMCSFAVSCPQLDQDYDMEITPNGPTVPVKLTEMLLSFDVAAFNLWKQAEIDAEMQLKVEHNKKENP